MVLLGSVAVLSTLGWPESTEDLRKFYPTSVLSTGYDILFFWVVRMMMFGLYAMDEVQPFDHVFLHGLIRDQHGKKMSKSKGNGIDPLDWMERYGADVTRFTLLRGTNPGSDMAVSEERAAGFRNFTTKLWNATRFALANGATVERPLPDRAELTAADRWILDELDALVSTVDSNFEAFQFSRACEALYSFTWDEFCDWYLEIAKVQIADGRAEATQSVLGHVLDVLLRLLHPSMPFVTETLWTSLTGGESLVVALVAVRRRVRARMLTRPRRSRTCRSCVTEIRRFRTDQGLADRQKVARGLRRVLRRPDRPGPVRARADVAHRARRRVHRLRDAVEVGCPRAR